MQALSKACQGDVCTIKWMFGLPEVLSALHNCEVKEGSAIRVIEKHKDNLIIAVKQRRIAIGNEVADRIQV